MNSVTEGAIRFAIGAVAEVLEELRGLKVRR
jgi:hypothetical protein